MFSIIIPTFNNKRYLELCIKSIKKNSLFNHEIIPHVNIGDDGTIDLLKKINIDYSHTSYNAGICEGMNRAAKKAKSNYAVTGLYFYPNNVVKVFNRWGSIVYLGKGYDYDGTDDPTNSTTKWDGKRKGELLPVAVYYYVIELNDSDDTTLGGSITIMR